MAEAECLHARVVTTVEMIVDNHADSETCAECVAEQVVITLCAS